MIKRLLLLGLLFAGQAIADIAVQNEYGGTTEPVSVTVGAGSDLGLVCTVVSETAGGAAQPTGIVFNTSEALTSAVDSGDIPGGTDTVNASVWYLADPSVTTADVDVTFASAPGNFYVHCYVLTDFAQSSIVADIDTDGIDGPSACNVELDVALTEVDGGFGVAGYICAGGGGTVTWTDFTEDFDSGTSATKSGAAAVLAGTDAITPGATANGGTGDQAIAGVIFNQAAAAGPVFTVGPSVAAATNGYTISGTITCTGTCTVYAASWPPAASAPADCDAVQAASGALIAASEAWTTAVGDSFALTEANNIPRQDVYVCGSDGTTDTAVTASADTNRSADTNQTITVLASVSGTSLFALATDSTGDTTEDSFEITGMADTSDFAVGMLVDVSAGFADLTDLIVTAVSASSITLEIASNATTANITVTSNVYFNPTVAAGDVVEGDTFANPVPSDGTHTGSGNAATLTDSTATFTVDALIGSRIANDTDGSACTITDNDATTVTCTLTGGSENDWDVSDAYTILPLITWETDGDLSYTAFSGAVLTTIGYCIEDVSGATGVFTTPSCWTTDDVAYLFNTVPDFDDMGPFDDILVWSIDVALADVDLTNYCTDVDAHTLTFTYTGTPATGVTFNANGTVTGTPTVEDETGAAMSVLCGDPGQLYARQSFTQYVIDTYTAPDCTDANTVTECATEWDTAAPWYGDSSDYMTATFEYSATVATGDIISQDPVESSEVADPLAPIELVVSLGVAGGANKLTVGPRITIE